MWGFLDVWFWLDQNIAIGKDALLRMKKSSQRAEGGAVCVRYVPTLKSTNLQVM